MGDQPQAIDRLIRGLNSHQKYQVLLGATGTGKTFTMANVINSVNRPTIVLAHNKTLAAQLFGEFKRFFPDNAVHYFVSYFDYYQPEAYIVSSDTYIEKDSRINEEIERLRHAATDAILTRRDVIIVASVSCIYGIGSPEDYMSMSINLETGNSYGRDWLLRRLNSMQYRRNDIDFTRGNFRVRGDTIDVCPSALETAYRLEFFGDELERILEVDPLTGEILQKLSVVRIFPNTHYATPEAKLKQVIAAIRQEYDSRMQYFQQHNKLLEAQRLSQRIKYDVEMMEQTGSVKGIENYSRYLSGRQAGEQPITLLDYMPDDYLMIIDESHMTLPQIRGMYAGDRARKETLVEYGFRLPSALDNRPLTFNEFERHINQVICVSATPGEYELSRTGRPVEQVIRPTGLLDPSIEVRPSDHQVDDIVNEIRQRIERNQRVLITTLTKRMAEDLSEYLIELGIKTAYIHSDVTTLERSDIIKDLRLGKYDVLVGINLLREGLDLPEVSLVCIVDADKEGFLRSVPALIQTIGRAARHVEGKVIMYGDNMTDSMRQAIDETNRRRTIQREYNAKHHVTPHSVAKKIDAGLRSVIPVDKAPEKTLDLKKIPREEYAAIIKDLTQRMNEAAEKLEFEQAAELRDTIARIRQKL